MIMHMHAFRASASFPVTKGCLTFMITMEVRTTSHLLVVEICWLNIFHLSWIELWHVIYHCPNIFLQFLNQ